MRQSFLALKTCHILLLLSLFFQILQYKRNVQIMTTSLFIYYDLYTSRIYKRFLNTDLPFLQVNIAWTSWYDSQFKCAILFRSQKFLEFFIQGVSYSSLKRIFKVTFIYQIRDEFLNFTNAAFVSFIWLSFFWCQVLL